VSVATFIATQRAQFLVPHATSCRAFGVSQAWFYKWRHGDPSARHARRQQLRVEIGRLFAVHKSRYGSPRITADLRDQGWSVSVNTVAQLMAELGLRARPPRRRRRQTTRQGRGRWRAPDLINRQFDASGINQKWFGDGTEISTDEGKLYLDSVLDLGSRRVIGFGLSEHHDTDLAYGALAMAVAVRGGKDAVAGVIFHSDQGGEYTGHQFREACLRMGFRQSMGRPGSALDNAVIESWHSTVEFELRRLEHFTTRAQARTGVAAWIDDYNTARRHSALDMLAPVRFEQTMTGVPTGHDGAVLTGVKAKPSGWPSASVDPGSGRHKPAVIRRRSRMHDKIKSH
jgi:transposase InsO family protein